MRAAVPALLLILPAIPSVASLAQKASQVSDLPEMLATQQGFLAISTPKGWVRTDGPGLAYFVPQVQSNGDPSVWIYISWPEGRC
jgi:hypothetical protein